MREKIFSVARFPALHPKPVFERSERTYETGAFDKKTPSECGRMSPYCAWPPQCQQRAEYDEKHEKGMQERDGIGEQNISLVHESVTDNAAGG